MQYLQKHSLYISNPKQSHEFYANKLGMYLIKTFKKDDIDYFHYCFEDTKDTKQAILELIFDKQNKQSIFPKPKDTLQGYWKMAISIKDVDIAREKLIENGVDVQEAIQVPNVAYLCHFYDPDGYCLELIQHKFKQNHIKQKEDSKYLLGNKPVFSLITYRVKDIQKSLDFYIDKLKLKLLSKMELKQRGFDLYFLALSDEELPNKDVESIQNRQWLWEREYTMIELQHILDIDDDFIYEVGIKTGFKGISFSSLDKQEVLNDPDGYEIVKK